MSSLQSETGVFLSPPHGLLGSQGPVPTKARAGATVPSCGAGTLLGVIPQDYARGAVELQAEVPDARTHRAR